MVEFLAFGGFTALKKGVGRGASNMQLGIIGLGKMGGNLALQANEKKIQVIGKARSKKPELEKQGVKVVTDYESFVGFLKHPRVVYLSLPAGPTVDGVLDRTSTLPRKGRRGNGWWQFILP